MDFEKQHIVPQSYLRRFATQNIKNKKCIIGVRDKAIRCFQQSVENVGYLRNYYDTSYHDDEKYWEHFFANELEPLYGNDLNHILTKITMSAPESIVLSDNDKRKLSVMICFQLFRCPDYVDNVIEDIPSMLHQYQKEIKNASDLTSDQKRIIKKIAFSKDERKENIIQMITDTERLQRFSNVLLNKNWMILYNSMHDIIPYITSDNPAVIYNYTTNIRNKVGIGRDDIIIYYPLTPKIMVAIYPKIPLFSTENSYDRVCILNETDITQIIRMNKLQIEGCYKQAFIPLNYYNQIMKSNSSK